MDYHESCKQIIKAIEKFSAKLTDEQKQCLYAAVSVSLDMAYQQGLKDSQK